MRTIKRFNERNVTLLKSLSLLLFLFHCDFNQCLVSPIETQTCLFTTGAEAPEVRSMSGFRGQLQDFLETSLKCSVSIFSTFFCVVLFRGVLSTESALKCKMLTCRTLRFIYCKGCFIVFTCMILVQSGSVRLSHDAAERNLLTVLLVF